MGKCFKGKRWHRRWGRGSLDDLGSRSATGGSILGRDWTWEESLAGRMEKGLHIRTGWQGIFLEINCASCLGLPNLVANNSEQQMCKSSLWDLVRQDLIPQNVLAQKTTSENCVPWRMRLVFWSRKFGLDSEWKGTSTQHSSTCTSSSTTALATRGTLIYRLTTYPYSHGSTECTTDRSHDFTDFVFQMVSEEMPVWCSG